MHDVAEFLSAHDPFAGLEEAELERLGRRTEVEFFAAGTTILPQGGEPPPRIRVVRRGAVALLDHGNPVDLLGEGELFGHPSVLSGHPARFEAQAHEDSLCYSLPAEDVVPLLGRRSSIRFLARSLLERTGTRDAPPADAPEADVSQQTAGSLVRRPPVVCSPELTVREAAQRMVSESVSSVLIPLGAGEFGILTDRDLRTRVVADGLSIDDPVTAAMSSPVIGVGEQQTGADVMLTMLDHDIRHVPVFTSDSNVVGMIVGTDLLAAEASAPFVLRRAITEAHSKADLTDAAGRLRSTVVSLHRAGLGAARVSEVISAVADAVVRRMIELAIETEGRPPVEFSWMSLGSHGRREPVPSSDVDSGMAWQDRPAGGEGGQPESTTAYMHSIAEDVADCIRAAGWRLDPHGVTAAGVFSASSIEDWRRSIASWLQRPSDNRVLIATSILLDGRTIYGPGRELDVKAMLFEAGDRSTLLSWMLRLALAAKPPTGFFHDIVVESSGEHRGTFDIKHGALLPIVDLARYAALKAGIRMTPTVARLQAAADEGALDEEQARVLTEAHELFGALRLDHQVSQLEAGVPPDDHVDPKLLSPLTRRYLRDAFREVAAVQRAISGEVSTPPR
jgi:CBS domain-containing protein